MKRFILFFATIASFLLACSCTKGRQSGDEQGADIEYYVKYASNGLAGRYDASYQDVDKVVSLRSIAGENFERIVGPVPKGFRAFLTIKGDYLSPSVRIEVKKGDNPFVVKAEAVGMTSFGGSVNYVIE